MPGRVGVVAGLVPGWWQALRWCPVGDRHRAGAERLQRGWPWLRCSRGEFAGAGVWSVVGQGLSGENSGKMGIFLITNRKD